MAVAALQQQHREIQTLEREVKELRAQLSRRLVSAGSSRSK
jgi:hypothetical protein